MLHDLQSIRRVLVAAHNRITQQPFRQKVLLLVFQNRRRAVGWGSNDCGFEWIDEVDHAMQQLEGHGFEYMDSEKLLHDLVNELCGSVDLRPGWSYEFEFTSMQVADALARIIALTPTDVSTDPRIRDALVSLSSLEQKFLKLLAEAGDGTRVANDDIAKHCWSDAADDEMIRNVYRGIQVKLRTNRDVRVVNARKGYRLELKN